MESLENGLISQRLEAAVELAQLTERSVFALASKPRPDARLRALFAGKGAALVQNFNNPPQVAHRRI